MGRNGGASGRKGKRGRGGGVGFEAEARYKDVFDGAEEGSKDGSDACTVAVTCDTSFRRNRCHNVEP